MARLIVTETAGQSRRWLEWGNEGRNFDPATSLLIDSDSLVVSGFGGTQTTRTGAYDPDATANNVVRATLLTQSTAVCGTGNLSHVGSFRVIARAYAVAAANLSDIQVRLAWQEGAGPFRANTYVAPIVNNGFSRLDLGIITIPKATLGTQRWSGRIEAYSKTTGDVLDIDFLVLIPVDHGYGKIRGAYSYRAGAITGHDEFTATTAGNALNARVAPQGGTWATSGAATDFTFRDGGLPGTSTESLGRSSTSDTGAGRFAILGSSNLIDTEVGVNLWSTDLAVNMRRGVVARWVDASNYLLATVSNLDFSDASLIQVVAGVETVLATKALAPRLGDGGTIRLVCFASGNAYVDLVEPGGAVRATLSATSSALATGGALQTGKPGVLDRQLNAFASTRYFDNFYVAAPPAEPIALYSGRQLEIRHDGVIQQDSTGTFWGPPAERRGGDFFVQPAGSVNRTTRVMVLAHRNDLEVAEWSPLGDSLQIQVARTPKYIHVPR